MESGQLKYKLNSGRLMPLVGFGTFLIQGDSKIYQVLDYALNAGYRSIDTAAVYHNETSIGKALKDLLPKYNLKREDIFITTKLAPDQQGDKAAKAIKRSIANLECDYLDLYLIHWPGVGRVPSSSLENKKLRSQSWKCMVDAVKNGLVKDIGVSNYTVNHLKELLSNDYGIKPAVNQVECHPKYPQRELLNFCTQEEILLQAYSSLGGTGNGNNLLENYTVKQISQQLGKTSAQVLLRWAIQQNIAIIPKASSEERIKKNIELNFALSDKHFESLSKFEEEKYAWDPIVVA